MADGLRQVQRTKLKLNFPISTPLRKEKANNLDTHASVSENQAKGNNAGNNEIIWPQTN